MGSVQEGSFVRYKSWRCGLVAARLPHGLLFLALPANTAPSSLIVASVCSHAEQSERLNHGGFLLGGRATHASGVVLHSLWLYNSAVQVFGLERQAAVTWSCRRLQSLNRNAVQRVAQVVDFYLETLIQNQARVHLFYLFVVEDLLQLFVPDTGLSATRPTSKVR